MTRTYPSIRFTDRVRNTQSRLSNHRSQRPTQLPRRLSRPACILSRFQDVEVDTHRLPDLLRALPIADSYLVEALEQLGLLTIREIDTDVLSHATESSRLPQEAIETREVAA